MFKKYLTLILTVMVINLTLGSSTFANSKEDKNSKLVAQVKANIAKLGTGKDAQIEVKLKNGTKLKGYVSEITDDHFSVMDSKTGTATSVDYHNAKQVKGHNLSTKAKIAIAVGITIGVVIILTIIGAKVAQ